MRNAIVVILLFVAGAASAQESDRQAVVAERVERQYRDGLSAYGRRDYPAAERLFREVAQRDLQAPSTIKSHYFLARTLMKLRRWQEASQVLIGIHSTSPMFYREWACDFLLGECRRALGLDD